MTEGVFDAKPIADALLEQCREGRFGGHDPFDGLNSSLFDRLGGNRFPLARIAWLQLHKRSPVNLRSLVGVPQKRNPKGIALFILGLIERCRDATGGEDLDEAVALGDWLLTQCVDRGIWKHHAWGYHFDWAARAFYVPRGKPNAITTCYVARALYELGRVSGCPRFLEAATDAGFLSTACTSEHRISNTTHTSQVRRRLCITRVFGPLPLWRGQQRE